MRLKRLEIILEDAETSELELVNVYAALEEFAERLRLGPFSTISVPDADDPDITIVTMEPIERVERR